MLQLLLQYRLPKLVILISHFSLLDKITEYLLSVLTSLLIDLMMIPMWDLWYQYVFKLSRNAWGLLRIGLVLQYLRDRSIPSRGYLGFRCRSARSRYDELFLKPAQSNPSQAGTWTSTKGSRSWNDSTTIMTTNSSMGQFQEHPRPHPRPPTITNHLPLL